MALDREDVTAGLVGELARFRDAIASFSDDEWRAPTRCAGWSVADVAAHVTGAMADITAGRLDGVDTQPWYDRQVAERRGRPQQEIVDELDGVIDATAAMLARLDEGAWGGAAPGVDATVGSAMESLWAGVYIHLEDVLAAAGRAPNRGPGLRAAVDHIADGLTRRAWGPATFELTGMGAVAVSGGGRRIVTDPLTFVLVGSGRADPAIIGADGAVNVYASTE